MIQNTLPEVAGKYSLFIELTLNLLFSVLIYFCALFIFKLVNKKWGVKQKGVFSLISLLCLFFLITAQIQGQCKTIPTYFPIVISVLALISIYIFFTVFNKKLSIPHGYIHVYNTFIKTHKITAREKEILQFLLEHKTYQQIAETLNISTKTVETHVSNIYKKGNVKSRQELIESLYS